MKFSLILILMVTVSDTYEEMVIKKRPNYCFDSEVGFFKVGESISISGACTEATCSGTDQVSALGCPVFNLAPNSNCSIVPVDYSKPYPNCCEKASCPE